MWLSSSCFCDFEEGLALGFSQFYYYYPYRFRIDLRMMACMIPAHPPNPHPQVSPSLPCIYITYYCPFVRSFPPLILCHPHPPHPPLDPKNIVAQKCNTQNTGWFAIVVINYDVNPTPPKVCVCGGGGLTSYFITTIVNHPVFCVLNF